MGSGPTESIQSKIKIKPQHHDLGSEAQLNCATLTLALSQREREKRLVLDVYWTFESGQRYERAKLVPGLGMLLVVIVPPDG
jgi:5-methylcytosine-specific restriction endonuclease McrBC regulatory subunit McrC